MDIQETDDQQNDGQGIAIYSKWAIAGFSVFFSPLFGGILLMLNLRSIGLKKEGTFVLLFTIGYLFLAGIVMSSFIKPEQLHSISDLVKNSQLLIYSKIPDVIGAAILTEYFFKKYFPVDNYGRKSIWIPLLIIILINFALSGLVRL